MIWFLFCSLDSEGLQVELRNNSVFSLIHAKSLGRTCHMEKESLSREAQEGRPGSENGSDGPEHMGSTVGRSRAPPTDVSLPLDEQTVNTLPSG